MIKGVLFDKDGTLIEFEQTWIQIFESFLYELILQGVQDKDIQAVKELAGYNEGAFVKESNMQYLSTCDIIKLWNEPLEKYFKDEEEILKLFNLSCIDDKVNVILLDGVKEVLKYLKDKNYYMGIATADSNISTTHSLRKAGIYEFFDYIGSDDGCNLPKPDPQMARKFALENSLASNEILIVGDSVSDMKFAKNSNSQFCGIRSNNNKYEEFIDAGYETVTNIYDIIELIENERIQ